MKFPCQLIMIFVNTLLLLFSLVYVVIGALFTWSKPTGLKIVSGFVQLLQQHVKIDQSYLDNLAKYIINFTSKFSYIIFILGTLLLVISLLGIFGAIGLYKCLIITYLTVLIIAIVLQFIMIVIYFGNKDLPKRHIRDQLSNAVNNYVSLESEGDSSLFLGIVMPVLHCCGYESGEDFKNSGRFSSTDVYDKIKFVDLKYPIPCCKMTESFALEDQSCPKSFTKDNSYIQDGCKEKFEQYILKYLDVVCYVTIVLIIFEVFLIVCCAALLA
uniref:Tetraspanin n=1 Tax=Trichobilharzia regenti TaxID=157069 RepID=A0AA85IZN4_TRIRE|nr:unnamed protein product [Trichobilharzia regenti]